MLLCVGPEVDTCPLNENCLNNVFFPKQNMNSKKAKDKTINVLNLCMLF